MNKEAIYLDSLLKEAPIVKPETLNKALKEAHISDDFLNSLFTYAKQIALSNNQFKKDNQTYLNSIFETLQRDSLEPKMHFSLQSLTLGKDFFPTLTPEGTEKELWNKLEKEIENLEQTSLTNYAETVLQLLHKYTVTIPCKFQGEPSVSFFDFTKVLSGISVSLFDWWKENEQEGNLELKDNDKPIILIGGDLSGIQDYIFDIVSKSAAKNLKGRSFYLELLMDSMLQLLLQHCGLFYGNIVYASGGSFLIIAPNIEKVRLELSEFKEDRFIHKIQSGLLKHHENALYLAVDYIELSYQELTIKGLEEPLRVLFSEKLSKQKGQRFHHFVGDEKEYDKWFEPQAAELVRDKFTGGTISDLDLENAFYFSDDDIFPTKATRTQKLAGEDLLLETTAAQIFLGRALRDTNYWISSPTPIPFYPARFTFNPCNFGVYHYLVSTEYLREELLSKEVCRIFHTNSLDNFIEPQLGKEHHFGFWFYGGNDYPKDSRGFPKSFNELAGSKIEEKFPDTIKGKEELGYKRLGVLRMDVDNLGFIIREITEKNFSFARYCTISRSIDYFFKGFLNNIWNSNSEYQDYSQIIYSGGDDLFIVGRWDLMLKIAKQINNELKEWTAHNPYISLSGGLAVVTHKFPIIKAAEIAKDSEHAAKDNYFTNSLLNHILATKNSFTLFGQALHWSETQFKIEDKEYAWMNEFELVEQLKNELLTLIEQDSQFSRGFLRKIIELQVIKNRFDKSEHINKYRWRWMLAYDLSRMRDKVRRVGSRSSLDFINKLLDKYVLGVMAETYEQAKLQEESNYTFIDILSTAARWAELEFRTKKNQEFV